MHSAVLLLLSIVGVTQASGQDTATTQPATTQRAEPPALTLAEAGAGPHQPLRFRPAVGSGMTVDVKMAMSMQQRVGGLQIPVQMIATEYTIDASIVEITTAGDIHYRFEYTNADVVTGPEAPDEMLESMRTALKTMIGLRVTGIISDRGFNKASTVEPPPGISPIIQPYVAGIEQLLEHMTAPLPEEPVGVGASWRATRTLMQEGLEVSQTSRYTLTASDGDSIELTVEHEQWADPQELPARGMPPGTTANLNLFQSEGNGRTVLRLSRLFPTFAAITIANDSAMTIDMSGQVQVVEQHSELRAEMKEKS